MLNRKNLTSILIASVLFMAACGSRLLNSESPPPAKTPSDAASGSARELKFADIRGRNYTREDLKGKVVLIVYWATWCPPCRKEIPVLNALYEKYLGKEVLILAISQDDTREALDRFLTTQDLGRSIRYPIIYGPAYTKEFGRASTLPTMVLMNRAGNVVVRHEGTASIEAITAAIDEQLSRS